MDIKKLIRIQSSAAATAKAVHPGSTPAPQIRSVFWRLRNELLEGDALTPDLCDELRRTFPDSDPSAGLPHLVALAGWIAGVITGEQAEEQMRLNAEAYARERVRAERGVGFE